MSTIIQICSRNMAGDKFSDRSAAIILRNLTHGWLVVGNVVSGGIRTHVACVIIRVNAFAQTSILHFSLRNAFEWHTPCADTCTRTHAHTRIIQTHLPGAHTCWKFCISHHICAGTRPGAPTSSVISANVCVRARIARG